MDRRKFVRSAAAVSAGMSVLSGCSTKGIKYQNKNSYWPLCLNTSTIKPATLEQKIEIAYTAGFDAIELWIGDLEKYEQEGGNLKDLAIQIKEKGLFVPNVIGLWGCMPMNDDSFNQSLVQSKKRMKMAADVGSKHIAAIPMPDRLDFDIKKGTDRYRELLKIGKEEFGIITAFEFVGFFKGVYRFGQAAAIALDTNDKDACLIMDTFHLYRGGSGFNGLQNIKGDFIASFHWNDVPDDPTRFDLKDEHRIYPGDGILPLKQVLKSLKSIQYTGPLSLELFNKTHWKSDLQQVAKTGLQKMIEVINKADIN